MQDNNIDYDFNKKSVIHSLNSGVKLIFVLCWSATIFLYETREFFIIFFLLGLYSFKLAKISINTIRYLFKFIVIIAIFNSLQLGFILENYNLSLIINEKTLYKFFNVGAFKYVGVITLRYIAVSPILILFVKTTNPSGLASSLNVLGIPYKISYAIGLALRHIPEIQEEIKIIKNAKEARGVYFDRKDTSLLKLMKNYIMIIPTILMVSLNRIEIVSTAMELRGFGNNSTRTWYYQEKIKKIDIFVLIISLNLIILSNYF